MIYLIIYIVGVIISPFIIPRIVPYEDVMWEEKRYGVLPMTRTKYFLDNISRSFVWPLYVAIIIVLIPIILVDYFIEVLLKI